MLDEIASEDGVDDGEGSLWLYASPQIAPDLVSWDIRDRRAQGTYNQLTIERTEEEVAQRPDQMWIIGVYGSANAGEGRIVPFRISQWQPRTAARRRRSKRADGDEEPGIEALKTAVDGLIASTKDLVDAFKTTSSQEVEEIIVLGFESYFQKSSLLKAKGIPRVALTPFSVATATALGLPTQAVSKFQQVDWSTSLVWTQDIITWIDNNSGKPATLVVYKFADKAKGTVDFLYIKIIADVNLADDVLMTTNSKSILGGLFSKQKTTVQRAPHVITQDDADKLQLFFTTIALGKLAEDLKIPFEFPKINIE